MRVESGARLKFVPPVAPQRAAYGSYEIRAFESGEVFTRRGNHHDLFNAFAWLAFPRTKAKLNALHARSIPAEGGKRGAFRDLLTILDEGGALVACDDAALAGLVRELRWKALFWDERERLLRGMRILVLGHAVMERALAPWAGMTCKALFVPASGDADAHAARWLSELPGSASPRDLPPIPVFGYPGWHPSTGDPAFYEDERWFRRARTEGA